MNVADKILTINDLAQHTLKVKGSQFISKCFPVSTENDAQEILNSLRKEFYDATHHCFAYRLLNDVFKYSDDGEPSGTAGKRILNAIDHFALNNTLVVVIRYYGGTKLGVGPLGNAYYTSALEGLDKAEKKEKLYYKKMSVNVNFSQISTVHHVINNYNVKVINTDYKESVTFKILVRVSEVDKFRDNIIDQLKGDVNMKTEDKIILE